MYNVAFIGNDFLIASSFAEEMANYKRNSE